MTDGDDKGKAGGGGTRGGSGSGHAGGEAERSPMAGMDLPTFRNFLMRALSGDETVPATFLVRLNRAVLQHGSESRRQGAEWWERVLWQQMVLERLREIDRLVERYNRMVDWHHGQAEKARARMQEATDRLGEIDAFVDGADEVLRNVERTGKLDRERAIELLRSRGIEVKGNEDEQTLIRKLMIDKQKATDEKRAWSTQYDRAKGEADYHDDMEEECKRKARELVEKRDAIRGGGHEPEEEERQLRQVSEEYKADIRIKAANIEKLRGMSDHEKAMKSTSQQGWEQSREKQSGTQVSDFEALAGELTGKFQQAAGAAPKDEPNVPPPVPHKPADGGPSIRA